MMTSEEPGAARPLLLSYSPNFGRYCANCGRPFEGRGIHCSTACRRAYQNQRRKKERRIEARRRGLVLYFCPVCGKPRLTLPRDRGEEEACSPCCCAIRKRREKMGLSPLIHKPNYALAMHLAELPRDPWQARDLAEDESREIWENALLSPIPPEVFQP